jgi:hypothetical protein
VSILRGIASRARFAALRSPEDPTTDAALALKCTKSIKNALAMTKALAKFRTEYNHLFKQILSLIASCRS